MKRSQVIGCLVIVLLCFVSARKQTLVIVDNASTIDSHSRFFQLLTDRGYNLDFHTSNEDNISFREHGEFNYEAVILFAPTSEVWNENQLSVSDILDFIDAGAGNVLIAGDTEVNYFVDQLSRACGTQFGDYGNNVIDHLHFAESDFDGEHTLIVADQFTSQAVLGNKQVASVVYQGNGMTLVPTNTLVFPILTGAPSAYLYDSDKIASEVRAAGSNLVLVAGLQARNNARVVISGSLKLFSDEFFAAQIKGNSAGNLQFADELSKWVFGERGIIRIKSVRHHLVGETEPRPFYTVRDDIFFAVEIEEFDGTKWTAYESDDVQLEVQMLDPYIRTTLKSDRSGTFSTTFKAPDVYGIFTFKLEYHRVGYNSLSHRELVTIRPFRHDAYERFIASANPYYASAFSMIGGVVLFIALFLFSK